MSNSNSNIKLVRKVNPFLPQKNCHVIYNIVNEKKWSPGLPLTFTKNGKMNLVVAASHQYLKNLNGLLEALELLSIEEKSRVNVKWFGGDSSDNSFEEALIKVKQLGFENIISFYPPTNEIRQVFLEADVIGLFSFYEGLPNVVCEAMMLGKPIISSSVSDVPLLLEKDVTFDPNNAKDIADKIRFILNLSKTELLRLGMKNRSNAKKLFDKTKIVEQYLNLLN